jgi:ubiquinone/menaquinone biosynthesis C-methylase UbiE
MENSAAYNQWHQGQSHVDDIATIWHRFVISKLTPQDVDNKKIIEIGCGRGGMSRYIVTLPKPPAHLTACDFSESALKLAEEKNAHERIEWKQEDIMSISFPDNSFDTAISCETIEHVPNPKAAIRELYRVLKPGGKLLLTCPNYFNPFGIWCVYRWLIGKPFTEGGQPYVNYVLMPRVYFWIKSAGFSVEEFSAAEIVIPARVPKHFYDDKAPSWLRLFGYRTFYVLRK